MNENPLKECLLIRVFGMTEKDQIKLCKVLRKAFEDNAIEIYSLQREWDI